MAEKLLDPESFGLQKCRLTKESMLFAPIRVPGLIKILHGEPPERPRGEQGARITDGIWGILELCWKPHPSDRPSLNEVLRCLGGDRGSCTFVGLDVDADVDDQSDATTASGSAVRSLGLV